MTVIGEVALWMTLPIALWGTVLAFAGGKLQRGELVLSAERSVYASFILLSLASAGVIVAFVTDRFDFWYVASYSNRELETFFKVSGLWAGQRGSLLFWALLLNFFAAVAVFQNRNKNREFMPYATGFMLVVVAFFVMVLLFADVNPFEKLGFTPANGQGLNPQLQNYWMTIHPPTLYLGFTAFTIPFAFAMASLFNGRLDSRWIQITRKWTLVSWFFLTNGIIFGMRWAYEELGWGGYWFWDPVENASLLPWLTATAFLHSIIIQENRGMLKIWNMSLVMVTFALTVFATFLTRSGLIESVHSFAENTKIALIFLSFLGVLAALGVILIVWRLPELRSENKIHSFLSRESAFLFNNLMFLAAAFAVLWGTLFPLITEGLTGEKIAVGPPFFNRVNLPLGLGLLALTGIGPVIAWRKASKRNLQKNFALPVAVGLGTVAGLWIAGVKHGMALTTFGLSAFVMAVIVTEFWKGTRARARIEGEGVARAFVHLVSRNRRRWGGYIVHVGMVAVFTAFAGNAFNREVRQVMEPGEIVTIQSAMGPTYRLSYEGISSSTSPTRNMTQWTALMMVEKDGKDLGGFTSEKRWYPVTESLITEVGIRSFFFEDLYIILDSVEDLQGMVANDAGSQTATFKVKVNPLVGWIWYGGLIITLGSLIAMWPSRGKVPRSIESATKSAPAATAGGATA
jgi:cytochrome c-type biogenesis protein CcmF